MKKNVISIAALFSIFCILAGCRTEPAESQLDFYAMREYALEKIQSVQDAREREIGNTFDSYIIEFDPLFGRFPIDAQIQAHVFPYEASHIANACISQFEVPPQSGNYFDFTFAIRPTADLRAPIIHGDALKGQPGMSGSFSMDLYNVNPGSVDVDTFLGDRLSDIQDGLLLVERYQRTGDERGKWIPHLQKYTSSYRVEIEEPEDATEQEMEAYAQAAYQCFTLFFDAYLESLAALEAEDNETLIQGNKQGADTFIMTIWEEDMIITPARYMFGDDLEDYFLDAFWRFNYYGEGL